MKQKLQREFDHNGKTYKYYSLEALNDTRIHQLPYSIRILLEYSIRSNRQDQVETLLNWSNTYKQEIEIFFKPNRVLQQDFTGLPTVVEMATMRNAIVDMGGEANQVNPACPVHMIIDHSIEVDYHGTQDAREKNEDLEFSRYKERFAFFKWIQKYFKNFITFPPTSGIAHQINLEYLSTVLVENDSVLYPDTCLGTDSHTPLINSIGVFGWGIGGIEAVSVMMGEEITINIPEVVGFKFEGQLREQVSAMDLALVLTEILRKNKVVGKFVEFYGPGVATLSVADRVTICSMAPEYGATMGYFPPDQQTLDYLIQTNRSKEHVALLSKYIAIQHLTPSPFSSPTYSSELFLNLSSILPTMAGPKRPHDCLSISNVKEDFYRCIEAPKGWKGFGLSENEKQLKFNLKIDGQDVTIQNGSILLCSITACTNTANHSGILAAGLLAKKAIEKGLQVRKGIKTSFSPGTRANTKYLEKAGLNVFLDALGFNNVGYGCMTCLGNSGDLNKEIEEILMRNELIGVAVTSADRNFEGRVHPLIKAHYLGSPGLVIAWAIAGRIDFNLEEERLGVDKEGKDVFLTDIWPSRQEIEELAKKVICPEIYQETYANILTSNKRWNDLETYENETFNWPESNYICKAPYFQGMTKEILKIGDVTKARVLAILGNSIPTDQISPAGKIAFKSPAGLYLSEHGVALNDFNSYGSRRAHAEVMSRGAFASSKLNNQIISSSGPFTIHHPTKQTLPIFDAAILYKKANIPTVIIAGKDYGCGSSRDSAAKGPMILGVKAIIAEGFERIHRANLIGVGVMAIEVKEKLELKGDEEITIKLNGDLRTNKDVEILCGESKSYKGVLKIETETELEYFKNGGILNFLLRKIIKA